MEGKAQAIELALCAEISPDDIVEEGCVVETEVVVMKQQLEEQVIAEQVAIVAVSADVSVGNEVMKLGKEVPKTSKEGGTKGRSRSPTC